VEENAQTLAEALSRVRTGAVAPAARDDAQGRFKRGDAVGFLDDQVLAWGDPAETLRAVLEALASGRPAGSSGANGAPGDPAGDGSARFATPELISVLAGEHAPLGLQDVEGMVNGGVELELHHGGQPAYWWLLTAE
jgi:hypothetical protein